MMRVRYRMDQLRRALFGRVSAPERAWVLGLLSAAERPLFARMARFDQRHCLDVAQTLAAAGHTDPALLRAALLHDCGKVGDDGAPIPLPLYGAFVVLRRLAPGLYRWAARQHTGPLRHFAVHASHERRAVDLLHLAMSDPATQTIVRDYAAGSVTAQTRLLAWADEQC